MHVNLAMNWKEWPTLDGIGLAELVRKGELTPREIAHQVAKGVEALNSDISAVIEIFDDVVDDPEKDGMNPDGIFAGVPFFMKDLGPTLKGRLQERGSKFMKGNRSVGDSFLTKQIRQAGFNIMGRTTTSEFGLCSSAENPDMYITRNPWDLNYTTNGSSAGTAASVAAGIIPLAHATELGMVDGLLELIPAAKVGHVG